MRIFLSQTSESNYGLTPGNVANAYISQKVENGYLVSINGTEVFAHCLLDLNIGDFLKLKVLESSTSQIVFKVIKYQHKSGELKSHSKPSMPFDIPQIPQTQAALDLLSKLNLHIKKERLIVLKDLFDHLLDDDMTSPIKDYLSLKALNIAHNKTQGDNVAFFTLSLPTYNKVYLKISRDKSHDLTKTHTILSFIFNTKNLGTILINLTYINGNIFASSTFEDKEAMNAVKEALAKNKNTSSLLKTMQLKIGKVRIQDFLFEGIEEQEITTGINLII